VTDDADLEIGLHLRDGLTWRVEVRNRVDLQIEGAYPRPHRIESLPQLGCRERETHDCVASAGR
jgi:hypothetical protein